MKMIKLKNGSEEFSPLVATTLMSLRSVFEKDPLAAYDLVMFVRNKKPPFIGMAALEEKCAGLVENGRVHDSIRNVVLSAVVGDGLDMTLTNPAE